MYNVHSHLTCTYYGRVKPRICESHRERERERRLFVGFPFNNPCASRSSSSLVCDCARSVRAAAAACKLRVSVRMSMCILGTRILLNYTLGYIPGVFFLRRPRVEEACIVPLRFFLNSARPPCIFFLFGSFGR